MLGDGDLPVMVMRFKEGAATGSVKRSIETKGRARGSQMSGASGQKAYRLKVLFAVEGSFLDLGVAIGKNMRVRHLGRSAPSDSSRQKAP